MKKFIPAHTLMNNAMMEQIDRIVEQQSDRVRLKKDKMQRGLSQWVF